MVIKNYYDRRFWTAYQSIPSKTLYTLAFFCLSVEFGSNWTNYAIVIVISIGPLFALAGLCLHIPVLQNTTPRTTKHIQPIAFWTITTFSLVIINSFLRAFWTLNSNLKVSYYRKEPLFAYAFLSWRVINIILSKLADLYLTYLLLKTETIFVISIFAT